MDKILRKPEVAERLGVSKRTLARMEKRNELPPRVQVSARIVGWRSSDIEEFLASRPYADPKAEERNQELQSTGLEK